MNYNLSQSTANSWHITDFNIQGSFQKKFQTKYPVKQARKKENE